MYFLFFSGRCDSQLSFKWPWSAKWCSVFIHSESCGYRFAEWVQDKVSKWYPDRKHCTHLGPWTEMLWNLSPCSQQLLQSWCSAGTDEHENVHSMLIVSAVIEINTLFIVALSCLHAQVLHGLYLLNHWSVCSQTSYIGASSGASVSGKVYELLSLSSSLLLWGFTCLRNNCPSEFSSGGAVSWAGMLSSVQTAVFKVKPVGFWSEVYFCLSLCIL